MEMNRGGKLPLTSAERYKKILEQRLAEAQMKAQMSRMEGDLSKRTRDALSEISKRKALKEEKTLRQMVVVKPRHYGNAGRIDSKGKVWDEMNNQVMRVNLRNGKISTMNGFSVGKYKPKSMFHKGFMEKKIVQHSPYHYQQRMKEYHESVARMSGVAPGGGLDAYGNPINTVDVVGGQLQVGGGGPGQRSNITVDAWGVRSNNVHGTFAENAHGGYSDNVWGGTSNNIWGGIGSSGGLWGTGSSGGGGLWSTGGTGRFWGSGKEGQKNYLNKGFWGLASLFGFGTTRASRLNNRAKTARPTGRMKS